MTKIFRVIHFFEIINDGEWNATIGRQGHVENWPAPVG